MRCKKRKRASKMKAPFKAALLSAFVFPGVGHFFLKRHRRGLVLMLLSCLGLGYVIWSATVAAMRRLDEAMLRLQGGAMNMQDLSGVVGSDTFVGDPYAEVIFYLILFIWIFAIVDAYRIGKHRES
jgi:hypothetical protein